VTRFKGMFAIGLVALVGLSGCVSAPSVTATDAGSTGPTAAAPTPAAPTGTASAAPAATCTDAQTYATYAPDPAAGPDRTGSYAKAIRDRGYLVAGVSADTLLLGVADATDPTKFDGFDIEMVRAVARGIWPGDKDIDKKIRFKVITAGDRTPQLKLDVKADIASGGVDLVARVFTITCARWNDVAFSAPYLAVTKRLLVPGQIAAPQTYTVGSGLKICAPTGTTSIEGIDKINNGTPVGVPLHTDCLALLQQGKVDAITGDDVILAGFHAQDPYTTVLPTAYTGQQFAGLGMNKAHPDFVRFVNGVLEQLRSGGGWQAAYTTWLKDKGGLPAQTLPAPVYGRAS